MSKENNYPLAALYNSGIGALALILQWIFGGPKIFIEFKTALFIASFFLFLFLIILAISVIARTRQLAGTKQSRSFAAGLLLRLLADRNDGAIYSPYKYIRHPLVAGIILLLNPALAMLFRSWFWIIALIPIYFIWKNAVKHDEVFIVKELGDKYRSYRSKTPALFPKISNIRYIFFSVVGFLIFTFSLVLLNFPSFYLRFVDWGNKSNLTNNSHPEFISGSLENTNKNDNRETLKQVQSDRDVVRETTNRANGVAIQKIGVDAPFAGVNSTDQKIINQALNNGVVVYPGSKKPGEIGNFFITAHSSVYPWNRTPYGQIFALLDKLEAGDRVIVYYDGYKYEYQITNKYIRSAKDVWLDHPTDKSIITLMTCWPIGTNLKRLVVEGELIE